MMIPFHFHIETPFLKKQPLFLKISERAALLYVFANLRDTDLVKKKSPPPQKKTPKQQPAGVSHLLLHQGNAILQV